LIDKTRYQDLTGQKFNHLTAVKLDENKIEEYKLKGKNITYWLCKCDCGNPNLVSIRAGSLKNGSIKSCGCIDPTKKLELTGKRFGKLIVTGYFGMKNDHSYWNCHCDCGNDTVVSGTALNNGKSLSCGCYIAESKTTHGLSSHPLYHVYSSMKQRCYNSNCKDYYLYGEKGVHICDEWLGDSGFVNFYQWSMDNGYCEGLEIDRIDSDGNYCSQNCRYVDDIKQANNTKRNLRFTINNKNKTFQEWCRFYNVNPDAVYTRILNGWDIKEALETKTNGKQHFKKDKLYEMDGEFRTVRDWCNIYNKKDVSIYHRLETGWDLYTALHTETDRHKHHYNIEKERLNH